MPRGMTTCRICGKPIPNIYRKHHEKYQCKEMRRRRGDFVKPDKPKVEKLKGLDLFILKANEQEEL